MSFKEQDIIHLCIDKLTAINGLSVRLLNSHSVGGGCINNAVKINTSVGDFFSKVECFGSFRFISKRGGRIAGNGSGRQPLSGNSESDVVQGSR